jgi:hypothetical protein
LTVSGIKKCRVKIEVSLLFQVHWNKKTRLKLYFETDILSNLFIFSARTAMSCSTFDFLRFSIGFGKVCWYEELSEIREYFGLMLTLDLRGLYSPAIDKSKCIFTSKKSLFQIRIFFDIFLKTFEPAKLFWIGSQRFIFWRVSDAILFPRQPQFK